MGAYSAFGVRVSYISMQDALKRDASVLYTPTICRQTPGKSAQTPQVNHVEGHPSLSSLSLL